MKLSGRLTMLMLVGIGLVVVYATDQILPATNAYQASMRVWLAARATGLVALLLLTATVVLGIVLSHPEQARWKQSKRVFPWHQSLWVFVLAFIVVHVISLVIDPYAGVGIGGALIPGLSEYRSAPVAVGVIALYALLITGFTARYTRLLPNGVWLKLHRFSAVVLVLAWLHGVLAGSDTVALRPFYWAIGFALLAASAYRYWVVRQQRATERRLALSPVPAPILEDHHVEPHPAP